MRKRVAPPLQPRAGRIYLRDRQLVTSAGVTAGIDLSLALVAEDHGPHAALAVAKRLVVFAQRQGGQSQFSPYDCGFGTADRMRIVFTRRIGVTPMQYRERFRSA